MNAQYTLGYSKGNTGGSNEATTAGNNARALADFDYDNGYNNFDVRHTFNLSVLYAIPGTGPLTGGWTVGGIVNARSGLPVPVLIGRNDIVYVDGGGRRLEQRGGGSDGGHQHAGRRRVTHHAPAGSGPRRRSVHQERRAAVPESGGVRDAGAGHVRQPRAQLDSRTGHSSRSTW